MSGFSFPPTSNRRKVDSATRRWRLPAALAGGFSLLAAAATTLATTNVNITQSPYSVTPDSTPAAIATALQQAVNDVGADPHGGTVTIPGYTTSWQVDRPIYVGKPNVIISGEGEQTIVQPNTSSFPIFLLGVQQQYAGANITAGHYPQTGGGSSPVLDTSVGARYGLRTWDGTTSASGYFSECGLSAGGTKPDPLNTAAEQAYSYWANGEPTVTFDFCINNNGTGVMKGQILGIGAGLDRSSSAAQSINSDKLTIFSLESDPSTGQNVRFKFRMIDATGAETVQEIRLLGNTSAADSLTLAQGFHRFSVQIDFATGKVASWWSLNNGTMTFESNTLVSGATITSNCHFKQFEWGAMRLGRVTTDPFSGTPSSGNGVDGDWTYGGVHISRRDRYDTTGTVGVSAQAVASGVTETLNDNFRYFYDENEGSYPYTYPNQFTIAYLPLQDAPGTPVVEHVKAMNGNGNFWRNTGQTFGFWLPDRPLSPPPGAFTITDMDFNCYLGNMSSYIIIGETSRVVLNNLHPEFGGSTATYASIGSFNCNAPNCPVKATNLGLSGLDALYLGVSQNLNMGNIFGYSGWTALRLVGCSGRVDTLVIAPPSSNDPGISEYYIKLQSGQYGGPITFTNFTPDNEGWDVPDKGWFYLEPSLHPAGGVNAVHVNEGGSATVPPTDDIFTVADPPNGGVFPAGKLLVERTVPGGSFNPALGFQSYIHVKSANWYGKIYDCNRSSSPRQWILDDTGGNCHIVTYHDDYDYPPNASTNPPTSVFQTTWLANCHVFRIANAKQNANNSGSKYTEYRCTATGSFATGMTAPTFTGYNAVP